MSAAKLLILENYLGQKVRTLSVNSDTLNLVYLRDSRRVEAFSELSLLDQEKIEYTLLKSLKIGNLTADGIELPGLGKLKLYPVEVLKDSPSYELNQENDKDVIVGHLQKSAVGHMIMIAILILGSWVTATYFKKDLEPTLVTIEIPKEPEVIKEKKEAPHVKMSQTKIKPTNKAYHRNEHPVMKQKQTVQPAPQKDVRRLGALAALGGLSNGHRGAEGLDSQSFKNIRAAGTGSGGGGLGLGGRGGARGYMPGNGLLAGSAGEGARAQSAGGYGTRGSGGGMAGYGKIPKVGGVSMVGLPQDEEPDVQGGLDRDQINAVINKNKGQIIYCYEKGLQAQPSIGGRVAVSFVINPAGRISRARVAQSSLGSRLVESCMLERMKTWQFPHPVGKVNVDVFYPFELMRVSSR